MVNLGTLKKYIEITKENSANKGSSYLSIHYEQAQQIYDELTELRSRHCKAQNPPAKWREIKDGTWQYHASGYAVYGTVFPMENGKWLWDARVMFSCERPDKQRTSGVAETKEGAMKIVEVVCEETLTCNKDF